ncbi:hypothetical protein NOCARDAX2BIS_460111 [Nocardioides sp. AX2bis]|nr:hypothetical protein NOCARDAX2BIS_460111 [Nocardioides sp. AX2bis]
MVRRPDRRRPRAVRRREGLRQPYPTARRPAEHRRPDRRSLSHARHRHHRRQQAVVGRRPQAEVLRRPREDRRRLGGRGDPAVRGGGLRRRRQRGRAAHGGRAGVGLPRGRAGRAGHGRGRVRRVGAPGPHPAALRLPGQGDHQGRQAARRRPGGHRQRRAGPVRHGAAGQHRPAGPAVRALPGAGGALRAQGLVPVRLDAPFPLPVDSTTVDPSP